MKEKSRKPVVIPVTLPYFDLSKKLSKRAFAARAAALTAAVPASMPQPPANLNSLVGQMILSTGAFGADGKVRQLSWMNNSTLALRIKRVRIWWGMQTLGKGDLHAELYDASTGGTIAVNNGDHYAEGSLGVGSEITTLDPYIEVLPNVPLLLNYLANGWNAKPLAHSMVWIWWQYANVGDP